MKKGLTELVFILDKSGSMSGLEKDTIGGFNSMLEKQKIVEGEAVISTVFFDTNYKLLHDRIDIKAVSQITESDYQVGGSTALIDAMGRTIDKIGNAQKNTAEDYRAEKVMIVIITDGEENSSREYSSEKVKSMIERQKNKYGWEFIFLGANIDAVETAKHFGIAENRAQSFHSDSAGTKLNYQSVSNMVECYREELAVPDNWNENIKKDFNQRGEHKKTAKQ